MQIPKAIALSMLVAIAVAIPAAAQEPSSAPAGASPGANEPRLDVGELTQRCRLAGGSLDRQVCLAVAQRWLDPDAADAPGELPGFGLGDSQERGLTQVTLEKVDWDFVPPRTIRVDTGPCKWAFPCFPAQTKSVAVLVRMSCDDYQSGSVHQWKAMDVNGFTYSNALWQKDLKNKRGKIVDRGTCEPGRDARFWLTFYVPKDVDWLRIAENPRTPQALHWTIAKGRSKPARTDSRTKTAALEERCHQVAQTPSDANLCIFVVRRYLQPRARAAESFGLGDPQRRKNAEVTVLDVDWSFKAPKAGRIDAGRCRWLSRCLPRENKSVAALVRYRCDERRENPNVHHWQAVDRRGFTHRSALWQKEPSLRACRPGKSTRGWITFYVPTGTDWLRIVERPTAADPLYWTVER